MARRNSRKKSDSQPARVPNIILWIFIAAAAAYFIHTSVHFDFTQDDAFISFRYAQNFINGHGLVYNIGERVEGYTNFLWVIILALVKNLFGLDFLLVSRILGVASGAGLFVLLYLLLKKHFSDNLLVRYAGMAALMLLNLSIAYWSIASLETAAFSFMVLAAIVAEYYRPRLTPALLIVASLLRPEGVLVFGIIFLNRFVTDLKYNLAAGREESDAEPRVGFLKAALNSIPWLYTILFVVPLIPFAAFKLGYYGDLFPNPYYAKTGHGFNIEYILSGLEYWWQFAREIGVYGVLFVIPLLMIKRLWSRFSLIYLFVLIYSLYIIYVGGDVLKVYRFFVPVVSAFYFLFVAAVFELVSMIKFPQVARNAVALLLIVAVAVPAWLFSRNHVYTFHYFEVNIVRKMHFDGTMLKRYMGPDFSLAASTIGMIGYQLIGHRVIDMLGLTDKYIARHPEDVKGVVTTWKERRFNDTYLLSQAPDIILFSTGYKPSAPAERVLMLHSEFRDKYRSLGFPRVNQYKVMWRKIAPVNMDSDKVLPDPKFSERIADGLYALNRKTPQEAINYFYEAWDRLGKEYLMLDYFIGGAYSKANQTDSSLAYYDRCLKLYPDMWEVHLQLFAYYRSEGDSLRANLEVEHLKTHDPWMFDTRYQTYNPNVELHPPSE